MFHSAHDGKGIRHVFVNGYRIKNVHWANVEQGLVCYAPLPLKINRRKGEIYTRLLRGNVEVEYVSRVQNRRA